MQSEDPDFVRHTITLIFDVPVARAGDEITIDLLNLVSQRIVDLVAGDTRVQALMRRAGIEWGWGEGTWERLK